MSLSLRFDRALALAADLHRHQVRKGTAVPYVAHLLAVAAIVMEYGGDEDQAIAALLHDAVEDQGGAPTLARIRQEFGERVADMVDACSDTDEVPKPPWRARKEAYIAHVGEIDSDALMISMADKLHNARAILADHKSVGDDVWDRFTGGREGTVWYYRALVEAYRPRTSGPLLDELDGAVTEIERRVRR